MRPFQYRGSEHRFRNGIEFEQVKNLYVFDKEQRLLLLDPLERIEVALRALLTNTLALKYGSDCLSSGDIFHSDYDHQWLLEKLRKSKYSKSEAFLKHYKKKYTSPEFPPIWMTLETLSFSEISKIFEHLKHTEDKQVFVGHFGWPDPLLSSWFRALSVLRNTCAHHGRVWNREYSVKPKLPSGKHRPQNWPTLTQNLSYKGMIISAQARTSRLAALLIVIQALMKNISPDSQWSTRLKALLETRTPYELLAMGLSLEWAEDDFWKIN